MGSHSSKQVCTRRTVYRVRRQVVKLQHADNVTLVFFACHHPAFDTGNYDMIGNSLLTNGDKHECIVAIDVIVAIKKDAQACLAP